MSRAGSKKIAVLLLTVLLLCTPLLWAHGIDVAVGKRYPCVFVKAEYSGSTAVSGAEVTITLEAGETGPEVFQKGHTDINGVFSFCPHQAGQWTLVVDDLTGHRGSETITVDEAFFNSTGQTQTPTGGNGEPEIPVTEENLCCYLLRAALGVLLILIITFVFQRLKKKNEA